MLKNIMHDCLRCSGLTLKLVNENQGLSSSRGRFSECADALIGEEDRGDLERIYGEKCFDSREKKTEKRRSIMWKQFVLRVSRNINIAPSTGLGNILLKCI